ncbi:MAG: hypothetical protein JO215_06015 [Ktedonobacteraceae bacterium]|nr:hypothetical protein [Ktedonobacteraceae bacterium]
MQKTHMKLGLLLAMTCLFLAAGAFIGGGSSAHAQNVQASRKFHHWFAQAPHITVRMLSNTAHHSRHSFIERATIYGVGFDDCNCGSATSSYNACDAGCGNSAASNDTTCGYTSCSTTTTTTITTTSPSTSVPAPSAACASACSNTVPAPSAACANACNNTVPAPSAACANYNSCGAPSYNSAPSYSSTPSYNSAPSYSSTPSYNACGCNTVNLQSSAPISAVTPSANLSQIPVNAFGEFQVTVNVQAVPSQQTVPTVWAINSYNAQPSNSAPMCTCSW